MILTETLYLAGKPIGVIRQNTNTRQIAFSPIEGKSRLPEREWADIDELKAAVMKAYAQDS